MSTAELRLAAERLRPKLLSLHLDELGVSPYMMRYLRGVLADRVARLDVYEHLLDLAVRDRQPQDVVLVDFGGGHGVLSLLARELGVGTLVYCDIFTGARDDAERLADALGLTADIYVAGDSRTLVARVREVGITPTVVCSNDVIAHVYNLDEHLNDMADLSRGPLRFVFASEANGANPRIRRRTVRLQREVEYHDRTPDASNRPLDSVRAYREMRSSIIRTAAPGLSAAAVDDLASRTRGRIRADIERIALVYVADGHLPDAPIHPTNTCDPETGNWAERLMTPSAIVSMLEARGFQSSVQAGRYSAFHGFKGVAAKALNAVAGVTGPLGMIVAPYYVVLADRTGDRSAQIAHGSP